MSKLLKLLEYILESRAARRVVLVALRTLSPTVWAAIGVVVSAMLAALFTVWFLRRTRRGRRLAFVRHVLIRRPIHTIRRWVLGAASTASR